MKKIFFLLVISSTFVFGQTANELFTKANGLYKDGKYLEAIEVYEKIENQDQVSSQLYYNLGNCYYKLNQVAATIYNYEKALQLDPLNEDVANNLIFAKRLTLDNIEALPKTFIQKMNKEYVQKLSYNQWAMLLVLFSFVASFLFLVFYFAETSFRKRVYFTGSILSFIGLVALIVITLKAYDFSKNNIDAIIFSGKTGIKNAPTLNSETVFTLHEGTKVKIVDSVDNWKKIKLADGKIGWIISDELKKI